MTPKGIWMNDKPIDFVLAWVDGNDPQWRKRKATAVGTELSDDRAERYRDWGLLRYWFRGVDQFAPWVRRIFFVCDQAPPIWLDQNHPKLRIVHHEDFIPSKYLPVFSSHPIELNMHRIPDLQEQFVYFNDDMFLLFPLKPERFFDRELPKDSALLNPLGSNDLAEGKKQIFTIPLNNLSYLNRDYNFRQCIRKHPAKWYSLRYGSNACRNLILSIWPRFVGFADLHLPQAFLKTSFSEAWEQDGDILDQTSGHPLRNDRDVSQWLIRYRQLAEGKFIPRRPIRNAVFDLDRDAENAARTIRKQTSPMICMNDGPMDECMFQNIKQQIQSAFQAILPNQSGFEIKE